MQTYKNYFFSPSYNIFNLLCVTKYFYFKLIPMEEQNTHLEQLTEIRRIMEKSTKFISLSGISGVWVGIVALLGIGAAFWQFSDYFVPRLKDGGVYSVSELMQCEDYRRFILFILADAAAMLILALGGALLFTARKAKKSGQELWNKTAFRFMISMLVPLVTGGLFSLILLRQGLVEFVGPATLIFYGLALYSAGTFTLKDIRYLGLMEIALGLLAATFLGYTVIFWAIGFGLLHIIYGLVMYFKYER